MTGQKKVQKRKGVIRRFFVDLGKTRRYFFLALAIIIVIKLCLAAAPMVVSWITDTMQQFVTTGSYDYGLLLKGCGVLALLYFIGYGGDGIVNRTMVYVSQNLILILRNKAGKKLNRLTLQYSDSHPLGDTQSRVTNDMMNLSNGLESTVPSLLGQAVQMVAICVMMLFTNYLLALIYIIAIPLTMVGLRVIAKKTNKVFKQTNQQLGKMSSIVSDTYSNHTIVKAYGRVEEKEKKFDEENKEFERLFVKSRFTSGFMRPFSDLMAKASYILLCLIGGIMMLNGQLTLGGFMAFLFFGNMIGVPITELSVAFNNFQDSLSSAARIYEFLDEDEEPEESPSGSLSISGINGKISFEHVRFGYVPEKTLMKDVSFTAKPGQTMAIVGPSGAGKTTLINLLMRFYDIQGGKITLDDVDIKELSRQNLRDAFGMVLQDTWIFDGTIAENIAFGKPGATREEVIAAAKTAYCDSFIERLPDGYDTHLSNENSALSAGEKQLLSIARAIIADPKVLILDEATSQVDTKTEEVITRAMQKLMKGRTSFIIAHRLYTIRNADQIIFMVDGDIKEVGSHDELLKKKGCYASMYESGVSMGE